MGNIYSRNLLTRTVPVGSTAQFGPPAGTVWSIKTATVFQAPASGNVLYLRDVVTQVYMLALVGLAGPQWGYWNGTLVINDGQKVFLDCRGSAANVVLSGYQLSVV
jgi:hypothetical protein